MDPLRASSGEAAMEYYPGVHVSLEQSNVCIAGAKGKTVRGGEGGQRT